MKNHFARTGLPPTIGDKDIDDELSRIAGSDDIGLAADAEAAREVLGETVRRTHYRRTYLHYRAIAAALDTLDEPLAVDSYRWRERVVEFDPDG